MGIDGLLNLLKPVTQKQHISSFRRQRIVIDALPWIYKGCYSCAVELHTDTQSTGFLYYMLEMTNLLKHYEISPLFIFDGRTVLQKNETLDRRRKSKQENKVKGLQYLKNGQMELAKKYLSRCLAIDERIITLAMSALQSRNIPFMVAPYQADSQIAKMKQLGLMDAAISEDSDLIVYGVNVILKLNHEGDCDYIDLPAFTAADVDGSFLSSFLSFSWITRIEAAVLAGSDYNASIKGIGIKRAIKWLAKQGKMQEVIQKLKLQKVYLDKVPEDYEQITLHAKLIFALATVYNPDTKRLQQLRPETVQELKPKQLSVDDLRRIIGQHYEFSEDVLTGKINCKSLQRRELCSLQYQDVFGINKEKLQQNELANMLRKREFAEARKLRAEKLANESAEALDTAKEKSKQKSVKPELSEDEKLRNKEERKERAARLMRMMNNMVQLDIQDSTSSYSESSPCEEAEEISEAQVGSQSNEQGNKALAFLNPFAVQRKTAQG